MVISSEGIALPTKPRTACATAVTISAAVEQPAPARTTPSRRASSHTASPDEHSLFIGRFRDAVGKDINALPRPPRCPPGGTDRIGTNAEDDAFGPLVHLEPLPVQAVRRVVAGIAEFELAAVRSEHR